jgi:hypothetical protein
MDRFGFTIFEIGYLEKGLHGVRRTLKQEEQENSFGQYSLLSKQFEIGQLVINSFLTTRTLQSQATFHKACRQQLGRLAGIHTVIVRH